MIRTILIDSRGFGKDKFYENIINIYKAISKMKNHIKLILISE